jgi:von Willebrand factor type A domain
LIIKPLGHNRHPSEIRQIEPSGKCGLGSAILLSLGLHGLMALLFWHAWVGEELQSGTSVIDTRVKNPGLEVCLTLLDDVKPRKDEPKQPGKRIRSIEKDSALAGALKTQPRPPERERPLPDLTRKAPQPPTSIPSRSPLTSLNASPLPPDASPFLFGRGPSSGRSGSGHGSGEGSFFQIRVSAKSVVFVIDRSVSMGLNGALKKAKDELLATLEQMPSDTRFQILLFNRSVEMLPAGSGGLLPATIENKRKASDFLKTVLPEGGTLPLPALRRALALKPDVIFLLTDADGWTEREVREVNAMNRGHTVIHALGLAPGRRAGEESPLQKLARENRGEYRGILNREGRFVNGN